MYYTIIGTQWGDEGKGKIVDWLASKADIVVRFQGGNNAGHTLQIEDNVYKLNLLPSGIIRGKKCIIGNGVVLDPWSLKDEMERLKLQNIEINSSNLIIAENICFILPIHKIIDELNENLRGSEIIGTTKKGIGPAYEDKVGRRSIRLCDLNDKNLLKKKINDLINYHSLRLKNHNIEIDQKKLFNDLIDINNLLKQFGKPVWKILNDTSNLDKIILFEGAQGAMLDLDFGTYPYVTSSNTSSGQIFSGTGFSKREKHRILGITKAYTTRVGSGPFPTELNNDIGDFLIDKGKEFGTVTQRKRRCGWFDINLVKQSVKISGITDIILTKLDVLDGLDEIKICTSYKINDLEYDYFPFSESLHNKIKPVYKNFKGWKTSTFGMTTWSELPKNTQIYISEIEKMIGAQISVISTGPDRKHTIDKKNLLT